MDLATAAKVSVASEEELCMPFDRGREMDGVGSLESIARPQVGGAFDDGGAHIQNT